jgi:hypothetical protein
LALYGTKKIPIVTNKSSCFVQYPMKTREGEWMLLPVAKESHRLSYTGIGSTLNEALDEISELSKKVYFSDASVFVAELRSDVIARIRKINAKLKRDSQKEDTGESVRPAKRPVAFPENDKWIEELAEETRHVWGRPLERR